MNDRGIILRRKVVRLMHHGFMNGSRNVLGKSFSLLFAIVALVALVARAGIAGCASAGPTTYPPATLAAPEPVKASAPAEASEDPVAPAEPTFLPASKAGPPVHLPVKKVPSASPAHSGKH